MDEHRRGRRPVRSQADLLRWQGRQGAYAGPPGWHVQAVRASRRSIDHAARSQLTLAQLPALALAASKLLKGAPAKLQKIAAAAIGNSPALIGHHSFHSSITGTAASQPFFQVASKFVVVGKVNAADAPKKATDVAWLQVRPPAANALTPQLANLNVTGSGDLSASVYRLYVAGGQPPASCTAGAPVLSVDYAAMYAFYA